MLSNVYFLAKFRCDTAENEPAKNLQNFANLPIQNLPILLSRPREEHLETFQARPEVVDLAEVRLGIAPSVITRGTCAGEGPLKTNLKVD